jgi:hypothetical protein
MLSDVFLKSSKRMTVYALCFLLLLLLVTSASASSTTAGAGLGLELLPSGRADGF